MCGKSQWTQLRLTFVALEDAMNEAAWCYLEGFGCKKDKVSIPSLGSMTGSYRLIVLNMSYTAFQAAAVGLLKEEGC